jgi:hypothetical protein
MDWLASRHTHAWGCIGLGAAVLIGTVPLAHAVSPHAAPWWQYPGLFVGAVLLLFGLILLVLPSMLATFSAKARDDSPHQLSRAHNQINSVREVRSEIGTCQSMIEDAIKTGYYPWSSYDPKLPNDLWALHKIALALSAEGMDAYHFSSMAQDEFTRINRVVAAMSVDKAPVQPEHRLESVINAAKSANDALIGLDHSLTSQPDFGK